MCLSVRGIPGDWRISLSGRISFVLLTSTHNTESLVVFLEPVLPTESGSVMDTVVTGVEFTLTTDSLILVLKWLLLVGVLSLSLA